MPACLATIFRFIPCKTIKAMVADPGAFYSDSDPTFGKKPDPTFRKDIKVNIIDILVL